MKKYVLLGVLAIVEVLGNTNLGYSEMLFNYTAESLPAEVGWRIINYSDYESEAVQIVNRVLHISDLSTRSGSGIHYQRDWTVTPEKINIAEFDIKSVSASEHHAIVIGSNFNNNNMYYTIFPDKIESYYKDSGSSYIIGETYNFDCSSQVNTFKIILQDGIAKLFINGDLVITQNAGSGHYSSNYNDSVEFGSGSSAATGEAYFYGVRTYSVPEEFFECSTSNIDPSTINSGECVTIESDLSLSVPCAVMGDIDIEFGLNRFNNPENPFGYYWELDLGSVVVK